MPTITATAEGRNTERRQRPRIAIPFPVNVQGTDEKGEEFSIGTVLDNFSSGGLYLRMMPCVEVGSPLSIYVSLTPALMLAETAPQIAIEGVVHRTEEKPGGACGVAVTFKKAKFL